MIPHASNHTCQVGGNIGDVTEFTAELGAHSFMVLSAGLYSDRIMAPIRELCCNAYDAHIEVGTPDRPFEVHLPTIWEPTFSVKDYGPGLSDEAVRHHCSRYFASSKRQDANQIGALGLGMKSPLAYASSYMIESRYNGEKSSYAVYINGEGTPVITRTVGPDATDEPTGITIGFSVQTKDFSAFSERAMRALMYFPVCPIVHDDKDFAPYSKEYTLKGNGWAVRKTDFYASMSGPYVVQGTVAYPMDASQLSGLSTVAETIANSNIDLFVPIGAVSVAPSREALGYDPVTIANLSDALMAAASEVRDLIQADIDSQPTIWAARAFKFALERGPFKEVFAPMNKQHSFRYRGLVIDTTIDLPIAANTTVGVSVLVQHTRYGRRRSKTEIAWETAAPGERLIIVQQRHTKVIFANTKRWKAVLQQYATDQHSTTSQVQHYVVFHGLDSKVPVVQGDLDAYLGLLGFPDAVDLTTLVPDDSPTHERIKPTYYKPRPKSVRLSFTGFPDTGRARNFSRLTWDRVEIDIDAGGFYVPLDRFQIDDASVRVLRFDHILSLAQLAELMTGDEIERVYGFNAREIQEVSGDDNWVNLFDHLRAQMQPKLSNNPQLEARGVEHFLTNNPAVRSFLRTVWPHVRHQVQDGEFSQMFTRLHFAQMPDTKFNYLVSLASDLGVNVDLSGSQDVLDSLESQFKAMRNAYPMLKMINFSSLTNSFRQELVDYINMCEQQRIAESLLQQAA